MPAYEEFLRVARTGESSRSTFASAVSSLRVADVIERGEAIQSSEQESQK